MQDEIECEYGGVVVVTTDSCDVNGALRAGLGARFPFLSDPDRAVASDLDLIEESDSYHRPFLPTTFLLDSCQRIVHIWNGFWFWGNPTPEELRQGLRAITQQEQPSFDAQALWQQGSASPAAGIEAPVVWVRQDADGRETSRGPHHGDVLEVGEEHAPSAGPGGRWTVHGVAREGETVAMYLRRLPRA